MLAFCGSSQQLKAAVLAANVKGLASNVQDDLPSLPGDGDTPIDRGETVLAVLRWSFNRLPDDGHRQWSDCTAHLYLDECGLRMFYSD